MQGTNEERAVVNALTRGRGGRQQERPRNEGGAVDRGEEEGGREEKTTRRRRSRPRAEQRRHPRVPTDLRDRDALRNVDLEAGVHEVLDLGVEADLGARQRAGLCRLGVDERALARDEDRQEDAERPHLGRRRLVQVAAQDLGARERLGALEPLVERRGLARVKDDGRAKVDELDAELVVDREVLVLEVAVADAHEAERVDDLDDLRKDVLGRRLVKAAVLLDACERERERERERESATRSERARELEEGGDAHSNRSHELRRSIGAGRGGARRLGDGDAGSRTSGVGIVGDEVGVTTRCCPGARRGQLEVRVGAMADDERPIDADVSAATGASLSGICQGEPWCSMTCEGRKKEGSESATASTVCRERARERKTGRTR